MRGRVVEHEFLYISGYFSEFQDKMYINTDSYLPHQMAIDKNDFSVQIWAFDSIPIKKKNKSGKKLTSHPILMWVFALVNMTFLCRSGHFM